MRKAMRNLLAAMLGAAMLLVLVPSAADASGGSSTSSQVYVTHGLPLDDAGTLVDVFAGPAGGGEAAAGVLIDDFRFGTSVGPVELEAADYSIYLAAPTAADDGVLEPAEVIYAQDLSVPAGLNLSVVASFTEAGDPNLAVFVNDVSRTRWFEGRLSVRHAAAAPEVQADVGVWPFARFFPWLTKSAVAANGDQADLDLISWFYDVDVSVAESGAFVAGVDKLPVPRHTLTNVYAVGNPANGTFQFITQQIRL